jgi:hypothetical protein
MEIDDLGPVSARIRGVVRGSSRTRSGLTSMHARLRIQHFIQHMRIKFLSSGIAVALVNSRFEIHVFVLVLLVLIFRITNTWTRPPGDRRVCQPPPTPPTLPLLRLGLGR